MVHANNLIDLDLSLGCGRKSGLRKTVWSCLHPSTFPIMAPVGRHLSYPNPDPSYPPLKSPAKRYHPFNISAFKQQPKNILAHQIQGITPRAIKDVIHVRQARCLDNFLVSGLKLGTCFRRWLVGRFDCRKCMKMIFDVNIHPRERGKQCITTTFNNSMNR